MKWHRVHTHFDISDSRTFQDLPMSNSRNFSMNSRTFNAQRYTHISEEGLRLNSCTLMIRNIDLYVQIPGLSRTSANSRTFQAWNLNFQIPGLSRFSRTCANPAKHTIAYAWVDQFISSQYTDVVVLRFWYGSPSLSLRWKERECVTSRIIMILAGWNRQDLSLHFCQHAPQHSSLYTRLCQEYSKTTTTTLM